MQGWSGALGVIENGLSTFFSFAGAWAVGPTVVVLLVARHSQNRP